MGYRVFVTRPLPEGSLRLLAEAPDVEDIAVAPEDRPATREELLAAVPGRDGLLTILHDTIDDEVMAAGDRLRVISNYATGVDNVDIEAATRRGILVCRAPGVLTEATADLAWALMLAAARRVVEADRYVREGRFTDWGPSLLLGHAVGGKTLGVVGAGLIGTAVARRAMGFGMEILYVSPRGSRELDYDLAARKVDLETLLRDSDFVTLHCPLNRETRGLIGEAQLRRMRPGAVLVNTARGPIVDEAALAAALREGRLGGAGLDVYEDEPSVHPALLDLPSVVLAPHIGSATRDTRLAMAELACENLLAGLRGERPPYQANEPPARPAG